MTRDRLTRAEAEAELERLRARRRGSRRSRKFLEELTGTPWRELRKLAPPETIDAEGEEIKPLPGGAENGTRKDERR